MHTSTYAAEVQQRQPLLCSVAHIHFLKSLVRAEPQKINITCMWQMSPDWHRKVSTVDWGEYCHNKHFTWFRLWLTQTELQFKNHLKASLRSTSSLSLSWRSSSNFSTITEYDSPTFFFHSSSQPHDQGLTWQYLSYSLHLKCRNIHLYYIHLHTIESKQLYIALYLSSTI